MWVAGIDAAALAGSASSKMLRSSSNGSMHDGPRL